MSIWGSIIGGFVGFSFAGPIGALIGSMVGGRISSARRSIFRRSFVPPQPLFYHKIEHVSVHSDKPVGGGCQARRSSFPIEIRNNNLRVFDIRFNSINGGSAQYFLCKKD